MRLITLMKADRKTPLAADWDRYDCELNQQIVSIFVNLSAIRQAPSPDKPWLIRIPVRTKASSPAAQFADNPFGELQNRLIADLPDRRWCEFVGSLETGTSRELFFYSMSAKGLEPRIERTRAAFEHYAIEYRCERDSRWRQYREILYPGVVEMQGIRNKRVLRQLALRGDQHCIERTVDHDIYFRTDLDSTEFIRAAAEKNFRAQFVRILRDSARRTHPVMVRIVRSDPVTADHIADVALELLLLATQFDGEYEGWGCDVCTSAG